jgi:DNA-directed RNA polymerase specialized sigma24 family protein
VPPKHGPYSDPIWCDKKLRWKLVLNAAGEVAFRQAMSDWGNEPFKILKGRKTYFAAVNHFDRDGERVGRRSGRANQRDHVIFLRVRYRVQEVVYGSRRKAATYTNWEWEHDPDESDRNLVEYADPSTERKRPTIADYRPDLRVLLDCLPAHYREPIVRHFLGGEKMREIAESIGISHQAVHDRITRGVRKIRLRHGITPVGGKGGRTSRRQLVDDYAAVVKAIADRGPLSLTEISRAVGRTLKSFSTTFNRWADAGHFLPASRNGQFVTAWAVNPNRPNFRHRGNAAEKEK